MAKSETTGLSPKEANAGTKPRKEPVPVYTRINAQIKRAALNGKLTEEELTKIAGLCEALKLFVKA